MRQAGVLAAAGLVALREVLPLLEDDHRKAKELAAAAAQNPRFSVDLQKVETNIFMVSLRPPLDAYSFAAAMKEKGVLISPISPSVVRFVTHKDISDGDAARAAELLRTFN